MKKSLFFLTPVLFAITINAAYSQDEKKYYSDTSEACGGKVYTRIDTMPTYLGGLE